MKLSKKTTDRIFTVVTILVILFVIGFLQDKNFR